MGHQRIIGHRGARDLWPENSREGFLKVQALPIHGVEFDVHPTADGKLAVIHDPTLERTTEGSGAVAARTAAELAATRLRGGDEGVPMLEELLAILNPSGLELHVELKAGADGTPYPGLEAQVAAAMTQAGLAARTVLTSFWLPVLAELRRAAPGMRLLASLDPRSWSGRADWMRCWTNSTGCAWTSSRCGRTCWRNGGTCSRRGCRPTGWAYGW